MKRYEELVKAAIELLQDDDTFVDLCEQLTREKGFLDEELFSIEWDLNDLFYGVSLTDFLEKVDFSKFDLSDRYFYWDNQTGWICTTDQDKAEKYREEYDEEELFDNVKECYWKLCLDSELQKIFEELEEIENEEN